MLTNCLQLDVCPSQKCTRSFKFPIQMSNKKTIFSRQKSLEDTIQSYCWPIKDIFTVLRALSRYVYLSKDIWERWFFSSADKTFESRRRGDHERPEWHLTNDNSDQQHSDDKSLNPSEVCTLYSVSWVLSPVSGPCSKLSTSLELIICQLLLIQIE